MAEVPPTSGTGLEELEELPDDAIIMLKSSPYASSPSGSAPTNPRIPALAPAVEDEIVELGQDAIVGEVRGAHLPQPRTAVQQSNASVVINARGLSDAVFHGEKTVVVRDRRQLDKYAAAAVQGRQLKERRRERVLFFSAGIVAALLGTGVVVWLSSSMMGAAEPAEVSTPAAETPAVNQRERVAVPGQNRGTPTVSLDELPVSDKQR